MTSPLVSTLILAISFPAGFDEDDAPAPVLDTIEITVARGTDNDTQRLTASFLTTPDVQGNAGRVAVRRRFDLKNLTLDPENFDRWMFASALSEADQLRHLEDVLQFKIESVSRANTLTKAQEQKLRLAGRGDIKHFYNQVDARRREFELTRKSFQAGYTTLRRLNALSDVYDFGPFGDGSLFVKTLRKMRGGQANER